MSSMSKKGETSILLGSGFSIAAGLPSITNINTRLRNLNKDEFFITGVQTAGFYSGSYRDPNDWSSLEDRNFAEQFIKFYIKTKLDGDTDNFDYEVFYDYVCDFLSYKKDQINIYNFCDTFLTKNNDEFRENENYNLVWRFKRIISQLIASLLMVPRFFEDVSYFNYPPYDPFFNFISESLIDGVVNVHTLNHDIFFDHMASKYSSLWQHYTDGFSEHGSPYYGEISIDHQGIDEKIHKTYKVRVRYYTGDYDNRLRLFKLHGSIDNCILRHRETQDSIRVKRGIGIYDFFIEAYDEKAKKYYYETPFAENEPDYLTGTSEKIRQYGQPFYENLFDRFKQNLQNSNQLLIIGYGFKDKVINEFIENHYLVFNKQITVIDVKKPQSELFKRYSSQITFSDKGATGLTGLEYLQFKQ